MADPQFLKERIATSWALYVQARRLLAAVTTITERADVINASTLGRTYSYIQHDYGDFLLLRLAALFEASKGNATHSLPHLIRFLEMQEPHTDAQLGSLYKSYEIDAGDDEARVAFQKFAKRYEDGALQSAVETIRVNRDKRIAHAERVASTSTVGPVSFADAAALVEHARRVYVLAGVLYLGKSLSPGDEFGSALDRNAPGFARLIEATLRGVV